MAEKIVIALGGNALQSKNSEVGYMFGMYKKLTREFTGTFTGKGLEFGGSLIRPEATGFGPLIFFTAEAKHPKC